MQSPKRGYERLGRLNKTVGEVMHLGVITCPLGTSIPEVARLMTQHDISTIPVVDEGGYLAGIITRTDLVTLRAYEDYWREMKAENVMVSGVATITAEKTVAEASKIMTDQKIHRLIVVDIYEKMRARPTGVISQTDVVRDMSLEE
jgi:CBS-domain-containing membrane protein